MQLIGAAPAARRAASVTQTDTAQLITTNGIFTGRFVPPARPGSALPPSARRVFVRVRIRPIIFERNDLSGLDSWRDNSSRP